MRGLVPVVLIAGFTVLGCASPSKTPASAPSATVAGDELVFDSNRTGNFELFIMKSDGSSVRQLTSDPAYDSWFAKIEPTRRGKVVFTRTPRGIHDTDFGQTSIWIVNADGSGLEQIRAVGADGWTFQGHPEFAPDGSSLVFCGGKAGDYQAWTMDLSGGRLRRVTNAPFGVIDTSYSPDGRTVVCIAPQTSLTSTSGTAPLAAFASFEVATFSLATGVLTRLTQDSFEDNDPCMSPDGTKLVWERRTRPGAFGGAGAWGIMTSNADGSDQRALLDDGQVNSMPVWSLDGRKLYFHRMVPLAAVRFSVYSMNPDGTDLIELTPGHDFFDEYPSP